MAILYKYSKFAVECHGDKLTEQEHKDSCDINKMIRSAARGLPVRQRQIPPWRDGLSDDLNQSGLSHRIRKQQIESELSDLALKNELDPETLAKIPPAVQKRFGFRSKAKKTEQAKKQGTTQAPINDDDQTTTQQAPNAQKNASVPSGQKPASPNPS